MAKTFLSTPSARRATPTAASLVCTPANFYPRPPRGGRRPQHWFYLEWVRFLSTPSARRATSGEADYTAKRGISIHALREEGDVEMLAELEPED